MAAAAVVMMLVTGCQGDAEPSASGTSNSPSPSVGSATAEAPASASSSPEPSPASSLGPAANLPVPVKPALADENSKEGLEAFTRYWLELFSYGYETNDWTRFDEITDPGCRTCVNLSGEVKNHYSENGWISGGALSLNSQDSKFVTNTSGSINSFVDVAQEELRYFSQEGDELKHTDPTPSSVGVTIALWEFDHWVMLDFGSPEGT
ncbi:hypothetical protein FDK12_02520 [Arthrobacter sp. NamB2]|uniref:DUF6318 family protein n=1 Tax=Arthrobacter sp. NamB2 TaxID=2576035 RepID=UPI0010C9A364|nr:DUF6318 family protein [Arthrobacter sp. NamB2]TKV29792.1 hypothetical protein FDK12_02520 [Arthrobacter sp. NamB2]